MYYRRKVILALLQKFEGSLDADRFQPLLFLYTRWQQAPAYQFVPVGSGVHSFHAVADKQTMIKYELLKDERDWQMDTDYDYIGTLEDGDQELLEELQNSFDHRSLNELHRYIFRNYPYYGARSKKADMLLSEKDYHEVKNFIKSNDQNKVFTIGYEGIKAEAYMNSLLRKGINLLVDVRKNSNSMKFGFSKSQLKHMCETLDITFEHIPRLGIPKQKRKNIETSAQIEALMEEYATNILPYHMEAVETLYERFRQYRRIALTCYEKDPQTCHRHKITERMQQEYEVPVENLA